MDMSKLGNKSLELHRKLKGKIGIAAKARLRTMRDLSLFYTPGVGAVASYLAKHKKDVGALTMKNNSVAVISDGSAVLGLGNIGPEGALPVMEGKAMIFKEFAGIDAFPIVLKTQDPDEIVKTVINISPVFGGINLEDISAPRCFEIERRLIEALDIPVMHDDQHGTAIIVLAGLINALKVAGKSPKRSKIIVFGAGAAGTAITKILVKFGVGNIIVLDSQGIISRKRPGLNIYKKSLASITNKKNITGSLDDAVTGADALIGVSLKPGAFRPEHIKKMSPKPIVFALANPIPEIMPNEALKAGAFIAASGRSDFKNQINNALAFPGVFRGALDRGVKKITDEIKIKVAKKLAALVRRPTPKYIIPSVLDKQVVKAVASAVK